MELLSTYNILHYAQLLLFAHYMLDLLQHKRFADSGKITKNISCDNVCLCKYLL